MLEIYEIVNKRGFNEKDNYKYIYHELWGKVLSGIR